MKNDTTTFRREGQRKTVPDISLPSEGVADSINDWEVIDVYNHSDHLYITFSNGQSQQKQKQQRVPRWNLAKLDRTKFDRVSRKEKKK